MNRNDFFTMVSGKEPVKKQMLGEVYELVEMFPYFQSAHLLLLKGLNDNDDVRFNKQLRRSALCVANRESLYYYLNPRLNQKSEIIKDEPEKTDGIFLVDDQIEAIEYTEPEIIISKKEKLLELDAGFDEQPLFDDKKLKQSDLIDRFIIANPRIEPVRDKTTHQITDLSAPYLEETGGLVTETLARIYINQEYYSKAITIYEKLCLKYPEKSSYFAAQIEKIEEYIKK